MILWTQCLTAPRLPRACCPPSSSSPNACWQVTQRLSRAHTFYQAVIVDSPHLDLASLRLYVLMIYDLRILQWIAPAVALILFSSFKSKLCEAVL